MGRHIDIQGQLRDPRGVGFEQGFRGLGHKWDLGIRWFEEVGDSLAARLSKRFPPFNRTLRIYFESMHVFFNTC